MHANEFLFLMAARGAASLAALHDRLYTRSLAPHLRRDLPYEPHITLARHDEFAALAAGEATLVEIGASFAGKPFAGKVGAAQCVRIMTGGVVPEGADTVVMQERARAAGKSITFAAGQKTGQNVREAGEDLKAGSVALAKGRIVRPAELGLIASLGIGEVGVYRRLRVAFFSPGGELKAVGTTPREGRDHH